MEAARRPPEAHRSRVGVRPLLARVGRALFIADFGLFYIATKDRN